MVPRTSSTRGVLDGYSEMCQIELTGKAAYYLVHYNYITFWQPKMDQWTSRQVARMDILWNLVWTSGLWCDLWAHQGGEPTAWIYVCLWDVPFINWGPLVSESIMWKCKQTFWIGFSTVFFFHFMPLWFVLFKIDWTLQWFLYKLTGI